VVEGYQAAQALVRGGRTITPEAVPRPRAEEQAPRRRPLIAPDNRRCYLCGETGQIAWSCPHRGDAPMPTASTSETGRPCGFLTACWAQQSGSSPLTPVKANGKDATALLDSGSAVTRSPPPPDRKGGGDVHPRGDKGVPDHPARPPHHPWTVQWTHRGCGRPPRPDPHRTGHHSFFRIMD